MIVSIIIPIYNVAPYLKRCLDSVVAQSFQDIECILIDDCGTDNSAQIAQQYINDYQGKIQFKIIHHKKNLGQSAARNSGIRESTGEWLFFLDSDDALTSNTLSTLIELQKKYPNIDFAQGNILNENYAISHYGFANIPEYCDNPNVLVDLMLNKVITTVWNKLIKRSVIIENELFFPTGIIHEDMYWIYFFSKHVHAAAFTQTGTYVYYTTENSTMTAVSRSIRIKRYTSRLQASEKYYNDILINHYQSHIRHQYFAVNLLSCLTELVPLKSLNHWMHFWSYIFQISISNIRKLTFYRIIFAITLLPPACFIIGRDKFRWRVQKGIVRKI